MGDFEDDPPPVTFFFTVYFVIALPRLVVAAAPAILRPYAEIDRLHLLWRHGSLWKTVAE